jgi:hypothetical protein
LLISRATSKRFRYRPEPVGQVVPRPGPDPVVAEELRGIEHPRQHPAQLLVVEQREHVPIADAGFHGVVEARQQLGPMPVQRAHPFLEYRELADDCFSPMRLVAAAMRMTCS